MMPADRAHRGHRPLHARQCGGQALALIRLQRGLVKLMGEQFQMGSEVPAGVDGDVDRVAGGSPDFTLVHADDATPTCGRASAEQRGSVGVERPTISFREYLFS
jgi:hypothetical protein